jgi:eukaryotic-like serine/threonine-protein kinase
MMPPHLDTSRDLLFGLLALQIGLIDQGQLVAAFQAWTRDKGRTLADHLVARGDLDADDRIAVEALVAHHLKKHGGNPEKSLAAINTGLSTREHLARIGDADVEASLASSARPASRTAKIPTAPAPTPSAPSPPTACGSAFSAPMPAADSELSSWPSTPSCTARWR